MVAAYAYYSAKNELNSPIPEAAVIVPSDTEDLFVVYRSIYVGNDNGAGSSDVRLITDGGTTLTFKNVPHGKILPITAKRILATGTTATLILGLGQGIPGFVLSPNGFPAQLDIDFVNNQAWDGNQIVSIASLLTCTRASGGYYQNSDSTLTFFPNSNTLRYGNNGLLVEEARTNICTQSQTLDAADWGLTNSVVTPNVFAALDGTTTVDILTEDNTNGQHAITNNGITFGAATYTCSVYAKLKDSSSRPWIQINLHDNGVSDRRANFNLVTGTVGITSALVSASITALPNGWFRCAIVGVNGGAAGGNIALFLSDTDFNGTGPTYQGTSTSGTYFWGAQVEVGSFPTSYIPTTTTSATRAADLITQAYVLPLPLSVYVQTNLVVNSAGARLIGIDVSGADIFETNGLNSLNTFNGTPIVSNFRSGITIVGVVKAMLAADSTGYSAAAGGGSVTSNASVITAFAVGPEVGSGSGGSSFLNGYIQRYALWRYKVPNAVLLTATAQ